MNDDPRRLAGTEDAADDTDDPTASGIVKCLRMLAEEAASLHLARTLVALRTAMDVCAAESDGADLSIPLPPGGTRLH